MSGSARATIGEAELTIKDRLNFPYLLANQILTFQKAILALEFSEREIRETIESFVHLIPEIWKDDEYREEIDKAKIKQQIDMRPEFCGVKASEQFCKQNKIQAYQEKMSFDYYKMFQACINLLNRRGMLSNIVRIERLEGIDFDAVTESSLRKSDLSGE